MSDDEVGQEVGQNVRVARLASCAGWPPMPAPGSSSTVAKPHTTGRSLLAPVITEILNRSGRAGGGYVEIEVVSNEITPQLP